MKVMTKDELISACAEAYRTASAFEGKIKIKELPGRIASLTSVKNGILFLKTDDDGRPLRTELRGLGKLSACLFADEYYNCLEEVIISGSEFTEISERCFAECANIKKIMVPWKQGEVAGAPWGAENAEVIYGYSEGLSEGEKE